jgi:hypothetical protein
MRAVLARLLLPRSGRGGVCDPFETLQIQERLSRLAAELRVLDDRERRHFGSWHHLRAAQEAYERTLDDACRMAGIEVEPGRGTAHRLLAEAALQNRGWRW